MGSVSLISCEKIDPYDESELSTIFDECNFYLLIQVKCLKLNIKKISIKIKRKPEKGPPH